MHQPVGHRVLDVHAEVAGEDLTAGGPVRDQPLARREGEERVGDDLAEHLDVGLARADDASGRGAGAAGACAVMTVPRSRLRGLEADSVGAQPDGGVHLRAADLEDQAPAQADDGGAP